jgi:hypothetical protein
MTACTCTCCRRTMRTEIESTWEQHPRWMGVFLARVAGNLGWSPWPLYLEVFREMVGAGLLIQSFGPGDQFPQYMLWRLTLRSAAARKGVGR